MGEAIPHLVKVSHLHNLDTLLSQGTLPNQDTLLNLDTHNNLDILHNQDILLRVRGCPLIQRWQLVLGWSEVLSDPNFKGLEADMVLMELMELMAHTEHM